MAQINRTTVHGPAPTLHQVRRIQVTIEALPDSMGGGLRITTDTTRGWAAVARDQNELARVIRDAFTEAQVAAYARWKGARYDLDALTAAVDGDPLAPPSQRPSRRTAGAPGYGWKPGQKRPDAYDPGDWTPTADGRWRSPSGRHYKPDSPIVRRVIAARRRLGLPTE